MIRGTTPTIMYNIMSTINLDSIVEAEITLKQEKKKYSVEKTWSYSGNRVEILHKSRRILVDLTQEETLDFEPGTAEVQLRILLSNDTVLATKKKVISINELLEGGIIE